MTTTARPHDPARFTDCGNFEPVNITSASHCCRNCPGWLIHHQPYRDHYIAGALDSMATMARNSEARANESRAALIAELASWAHLGGWRVHITADQTPDYIERRTHHHPIADLIDRGFPDLLCSTSDRSGTDLGRSDNIWNGTRPGGLLAIWLRTGAYRNLTAQEASWEDTLTSNGGTHSVIWGASDIPTAVARFTGRHIEPGQPA